MNATPSRLSRWEQGLYLVALPLLLAFAITFMATENIEFSILIGWSAVVCVVVPLLAMRRPRRTAVVVAGLFVVVFVLAILNSYAPDTGDVERPRAGSAAA